MFLSDATSCGPFPVLEKMLAFTEARNKVLAENIANITTPGYQSKQLDVKSFQQALRTATEQRGAGGKFELEATEQYRVDDDGFLRVKPGVEPAENLLFHDGTNARIEREMSNLAENAMMHQAATELLKAYYDRIEKAISGRVV